MPGHDSIIRFAFHPERCVGCGACAGACLDEHDGFPVEGEPIRVLRQAERIRNGRPEITWFSLSCLHCEDPACARICPKKCFSRDEAASTVILDSRNCVGCGACRAACSFDAIRFTPEGKAFKCDGCAARLKKGQKPRCVEACPVYALTIDERAAAVREARERLASEIKKRRLQQLT